jgi:hypothetical protein
MKRLRSFCSDSVDKSDRVGLSRTLAERLPLTVATRLGGCGSGWMPESQARKWVDPPQIED